MTKALSTAGTEALRDYDFSWGDPATTELIDAGLLFYDYVLTDDFDEDPLWTLTTDGEALRATLTKSCP